MSATIIDGKLTVTGTEADDNVDISLNSDGNKYVVMINGLKQEFDIDDIDSVKVSLGAGDDTARIGDGVTVDNIEGNEGDDKFYVCGTVNSINGGKGMDILYIDSGSGRVDNKTSIETVDSSAPLKPLSSSQASGTELTTAELVKLAKDSYYNKDKDAQKKLVSYFKEHPEALSKITTGTSTYADRKDCNNHDQAWILVGLMKASENGVADANTTLLKVLKVCPSAITTITNDTNRALVLNAITGLADTKSVMKACFNSLLNFTHTKSGKNFFDEIKECVTKHEGLTDITGGTITADELEKIYKNITAALSSTPPLNLATKPLDPSTINSHTSYEIVSFEGEIYMRIDGLDYPAKKEINGGQTYYYVDTNLDGNGKGNGDLQFWQNVPTAEYWIMEATNDGCTNFTGHGMCTL